MSGGTELLALTGAAVQPLLFGGREAGGDVDGRFDPELRVIHRSVMTE